MHAPCNVDNSAFNTDRDKSLSRSVHESTALPVLWRNDTRFDSKLAYVQASREKDVFGDGVTFIELHSSILIHCTPAFIRSQAHIFSPMFFDLSLSRSDCRLRTGRDRIRTAPTSLDFRDHIYV